MADFRMTYYFFWSCTTTTKFFPMWLVGFTFGRGIRRSFMPDKLTARLLPGATPPVSLRDKLSGSSTSLLPRNSERAPRRIGAAFFALSLTLGGALSQSVQAESISDSKVSKDQISQLFGDAKEPRCQIVSSKPQPQLDHFHPSLQHILKTVEQAIEKDKPSLLPDLFHAKIHSKGSLANHILSTLNGSYLRPWDVSVLRIYGIYNPLEDKSVVQCHEDNIAITPLFGYKVQFGFWLQLMAKNDLARIFMIVIPSESRWAIGGFHIQQWTHRGQDVQYWMNLADQQTNAIKRHIFFDISQKLLDGGAFLEFPLKNQLIQARDQAITREAWLSQITKILPEETTVYIGTILSQDGPGLVFRAQVPGEITLEQFSSRCQAVGRKFAQSQWLDRSLGGIECQFILPKESPNQSGILGSRYFSPKDLGI